MHWWRPRNNTGRPNAYYERDKLRLHGEMVVRFAQALGVTTDELLGVSPRASNWKKPTLRLVRRLEKIEGLPPSQQKALLKTIDMFLKAANE